MKKADDYKNAISKFIFDKLVPQLGPLVEELAGMALKLRALEKEDRDMPYEYTMLGYALAEVSLEPEGEGWSIEEIFPAEEGYAVIWRREKMLDTTDTSMN